MAGPNQTGSILGAPWGFSVEAVFLVDTLGFFSGQRFSVNLSARNIRVSQGRKRWPIRHAGGANSKGTRHSVRLG